MAYRLPEELTIYDVAEVYTDLRQYITDADSVVLDGSQLQELDCSGVQLILWSQQESGKQDKSWQLSAPSQELSESLSLLQLDLNDSAGDET